MVGSIVGFFVGYLVGYMVGSNVGYVVGSLYIKYIFNNTYTKIIKYKY